MSAVTLLKFSLLLFIYSITENTGVQEVSMIIVTYNLQINIFYCYILKRLLYRGKSRIESGLSQNFNFVLFKYNPLNI